MGQKVWETFTNQKQWKEYLKNLLKTNNKALLKAIVLIYDSQTEEEKRTNESVEDNKLGFSKIDAKDLSTVARKIKREEVLTESELAKSRNKMPKYWKQLMIISKRNMQEQKVKEERIKYEQLHLGNFMNLQSEQAECFENGIACSYGICSECKQIYTSEVNYGQEQRAN